MNVQEKLTSLINTASLENGSDTPDSILAQYLMACLSAFDHAVILRSDWHKQHDEPIDSEAKTNIVKQMSYVDINDLPDDAKNAYRDFVSECGVGNGEMWGWEVGESGDDSTAESWIGPEKVAIINQALLDAGLKQGQAINLMFEW